MTWLIFIASTLACFRITRLITDDKITDWFRRWIIRETPKPIKKKAREGVTCPFCVSFYVATVITVMLCLSGLTEDPWLWLPAIWGGSVLWNQVFVKLSDE